MIALMDKVGRTIWHMGGLLLVAGYAYLGRRDGLVALLVFLVAVTVLDLVRLRAAKANEFMFTHFRRFIRGNERGKLTGSPWYASGVLISAYLYDLPILAYAVAFLAIGDVAATNVGRRFGTIKLWGGRSLQGTLGFIVFASLAGLVISALFYPLPVWMILLGASVAAVVEIAPFGLNDNLTIPVISGGSMWVVVYLLAG
jgi:dolichol kinase